MRSRLTDPETSLEAGIAASEFIPSHHAAILAAMQNAGQPISADELGDILKIDRIQVSRRMSELVRDGSVVTTAERFVNRNGRKAQKYALATCSKVN